MEWRAHFTATWFAEWRHAQLAGPGEHSRAYDELRRGISLPHCLVPSLQPSGALSAPTVRDVYTFGHFVGQLTGRLLALPEEVIAMRADWCGRFNLGISLFDYLADEAGEREALIAMPVFARLSGNAAPAADCASVPPSDVARALAYVAHDVLVRLEADTGVPQSREPADEMWHALQEMLRAELIMSHGRTDAEGGLDDLKLAARAKSAGPFRCMADFVCMDPSVDVALRDVARDLGSAIGDCFWLIDDACDLWQDLDRDRWNLFLLLAAKEDAAIAAHPAEVTAEIRLSNILLRHGWVQREVAPVVRRLKTALALTPASNETRQEVAGLLATAMQRWLCA